ncbi:cyclodeaminase [Allosediminivita pacifica]|uniref:Ornithine cyclodeaminase n=1 Tax=Allosediminivita pacifica TaxID=1267769 RepID=A0A2T6AU98_9RHOB|nr:cyclodeaminase [Allosediminivita pacifica]PTX47385.1 ornithine cyclodeaminase [Allosediminivita pacifica]GGB13829.1 cyclodeaminase [Allosediminivita pacifica]
MDDILIVNETDLRLQVALDHDAVNVVEAAFDALAGAGVVMPPVMSMDFADANGEVDVKTAYLPGVDSFAIKVSPGFFDNPQLGLPSLNGLMVVLSAKTGLVEAVLLDNGYLTNVRTAAAGAVAARHLAPPAVQTAGVIGSGMQGRMQMIAAHLERPYSRALVWSPTHENAQACAEDIAQATGAEVLVATCPEEVVSESQLVVTTTPSRDPIVQADWLHSNLHITAMGSDQEGKTEIAPDAIAAADLYACDRVAQCEIMGELRGARAAGHLRDVTPPELGQIIRGMATGRTADAQTTICDLTGTGVQDTAIARLALTRLREQGPGTPFPR